MHRPQSASPATPSGRRSDLGKRRGRGLLLFILLAPFAGAAVVSVDARLRPRLETGPLLQIVGPDELTVVWRATDWNGPILGGEVRWNDANDRRLTRGNSAAGSAGGYLAASIDARTAPVAPGDALRRAAFTYELRNPGWFGGSRVVARQKGVRRPAAPGTPFRFLAFGDSGNGSNTQRALARIMRDARPDLVIHVGDLVYPNGDARDYPRNFFEPYREMIVRVPFMPSLGNHDVATGRGGPFLDVFALPRNGPAGVEPERNYWFDFGDARYVALDTNRAEAGGAVPESDMRDRVAPWLRGVLTDCGRRWKFVFCHHPPYSNSTHGPQEQAYMRDLFVPVFDACGVDVVFAGHNHLYERTHPLRAGTRAPPGRGTVYIVTGAGGVSRYAERQPVPEFIAAYNDAVFSFTRVDVSAERVEVRQIGEDGREIDAATIEARTGL